MKKRFIYILAFLTGLLPGFFLVFNFMFSDVISLSDRGLSFIVIIATYLILGAAFGLIKSDAGWKYGLWLSLPALILALMYSFKETGSIWVNLLYSAAALSSSVTGSSLSAKLSKRRKR